MDTTLALSCAALASIAQTPPVQLNGQGLSGYISAAIPAPPASFSHGVSFYSASWPLLRDPIASFQIGLPSTWILPDNRGYSAAGKLCPPGTVAYDNGWDQQRGGSFADVFQTIEGGMGFWASTRFPTPVAKYRMNGTPDCYSTEISSSGWGFGVTAPLADAKTGLVQLSNRILVPPDGLTFQPDTNGQLFGVAWMAMPMTDPGNYYYQLRSAFLDSKNYCLDSNNASAASPFAGNAFMAPCGSDEQLWMMAPAADRGYFQLKSRATESLGLCLEGNTNKRTEPHNGAAYLAPCGSSPGQLWTLTAIAQVSGFMHLQTMQSQPLNLCLESNNGVSTGSLGGASFMSGCSTASGMSWTTVVQQTGDRAPIGDKSWTLILNSANFKGMVAFWMPNVWSAIADGNPPSVGRGLDFRPGYAGSGSMEVNTVPFLYSTDSDGTVYTRIPRIQFPVDSDGKTVFMQDFTVYSPASWFQPLADWFHGVAADGPDAIDPAATWTAVNCQPVPMSFTQRSSVQDSTVLPLAGFTDVVITAVHDAKTCTWGLQWSGAQETTDNGMAVFPEYYKQSGTSRTAVSAADVPASTQLTAATFRPAPNPVPYTSPTTGVNSWTTPGAVAGPFEVALSDGSTLTYSWYRFVDQPALQRFQLSDDARAQLQQRAELLQTRYPMDQDFIAPPSSGLLATLDGALLVTPPEGLEIGYVPIVTRQDVPKP